MALSLWLEVPELTPVVEELAAEVGNPPFTPHLTLVGRLPDDDAAQRAIGEVVAEIEDLPSLSLTAFGTQHEEWQFFCLVAERDAGLDRLFTALHAALPSAQAEHFRGWPHVSLLYGTAAARRRWPDPMAIADRYGERLLATYVPARMSVWSTTGSVEEWRRQREIDLATGSAGK